MKCHLAVIWYILLSGQCFQKILCSLPCVSRARCGRAVLALTATSTASGLQELHNHENIRTAALCMALDLRVAIAERPALAGDWCRQGLALLSSWLAFVFYWTLHIFSAFSIPRFCGRANSTYWNLPLWYPQDLTQCQQYIRRMAWCRSLSAKQSLRTLTNESIKKNTA